MNASGILGLLVAFFVALIGVLAGGQTGAAGLTSLPTNPVATPVGPTSPTNTSTLGPLSTTPLTGSVPASFTPSLPPSTSSATSGSTQGPSGKFVFPVAGAHSFSNDYGVGTHAFGGSSVYNVGIDIFATRGTPVVSPVDGRLHTIGYEGKGGNRVHVTGADGTDYYLCHMDALASGLTEGMQVTAGQQLGTLGDTGSAKGTSPHLHFSAVKNGQPWNPFQVLTASSNNGKNGTQNA